MWKDNTGLWDVCPLPEPVGKIYYMKLTYTGDTMSKTFDSRIKSYAALIKRVYKINPEAAIFMSTDAVNMSCFDYSDNLIDAFSWRSTPQGFDFWRLINNEVNEVIDAEQEQLKKDSIPEITLYDIGNRIAYMDLVKRVFLIDRQAASYLLYEAPFSEKHGLSYGRSLTSAFTWADSPQGWVYWDKINSQLVK